MPDDIPPPVTATVVPSPDTATAAERFLDDLADWADDCIARYRDEPATAGHDQLTYTTPWLPLIRTRQYEPALRFMTEQRDRVHAAHREADRWRHGYWRKQEAHHGTEHFEIFLAALWRMAPDDQATVTAFLDAVEHLGNWVEQVPPWFNYDTNLFRSMFFGTEEVDAEDAASPNVPDHFRCINLALIAYDMTGESRYLDLATRSARPWAAAIRQSEAIPQAVGPDGAIDVMTDDALTTYRRFAGQTDLSVRVSRAENFLCSDAITTLLRLGMETGETAMHEAAVRLLDELATQLHDPDAGSAADALRRYRRMTGDTRYDEALRDAVSSLAPFDVQRLTLVPRPKREGRPTGVGKRADMPDWFEDEMPCRHNPILLAAAAEIAGDDDLMRVALDLARTRFQLARQVYPSGRHHGCTACSVSAMARGHGRENHAGMVTAVLWAYLAPGHLPDGRPAQMMTQA